MKSKDVKEIHQSLLEKQNYGTSLQYRALIALSDFFLSHHENYYLSVSFACLWEPYVANFILIVKLFFVSALQFKTENDNLIVVYHANLIITCCLDKNSKQLFSIKSDNGRIRGWRNWLVQGFLKEKQRLQGAKTFFKKIHHNKLVHTSLLRPMNNFWFVMKNNYKMILIVGMTPPNFTSNEVIPLEQFTVISTNL